MPKKPRSLIARELKPLILPWITDSVTKKIRNVQINQTVQGGSGSGGGSGMTSHVLATNLALGPYHSISGGVDGYVLRASGTSAANFQTLAHSDLGSVNNNDHHEPVTAGDGISVSTQQVSVDVTPLLGIGLTETANDIDVDLTYDFNWTGAHSFASNLDINAHVYMSGNFVFDGNNTITTATDENLTIDPAGTGQVRFPNAQEIRTPTFSNGIPIQGWMIDERETNISRLTIGEINMDELHTRIFTADEVRVDRGEEYWAYSRGIVAEEFTTPALSGTVDVQFEDAPDITGQIFASGDYVFCKIVDDSSGMDISLHYFSVASYVDNGDGTQQWTLTHISGTVGETVGKGRFFVDMGQSGQGYIHLSTLQAYDGPWIQIKDWSGANPISGTHTTRTAIGKLDSDWDDDLLPTGYGLYSENAFLKGALHTGSTVMDSDGIQFSMEEGSGPGDNQNDKLIWLRSSDDAQIAEMYGYHTNPGDIFSGWQVLVTPDSDDTGDITLQVTGSGTGAGEIYLNAQSAVAADAWVIVTSGPSSKARLLGDTISLEANNNGEITVESNTNVLMRPTVTNVTNLGTPSYRWGTIYADQIYADTITGDVQVTGSQSGQTWQFDSGHMYIRSDNAAGDRTLYIYNNDGTYVMGLDVEGDAAAGGDLDVTGDITVGGTVDGVDIASFKAAYDSHTHSLHARLHDLDSALDHSGTLSWSKVDKTGSSIADLDSYAHSDLSGVSSNDHHEPVTGVSGISVNGSQGVSVNLASPSGLGFSSSQLQIADSIAGDGLGISSKVLSVNVSGGIEIVGDSVQIDLATTSGLNVSSGLAIDDTVAGSGLAIASKILSVGAGNGISVAANSVAINLASPYSGLNLTSGLAINDSLAGDGLTMTNKVLSVNAGAGLDIVAGDLTIGAGDGIVIDSTTVAVDLTATSGLEFSSGDLQIADTVAGNGLSISSKVMAINLASPSGLTLSADQLSVDDAIAGAGLTMTSKVLAVGAGTGITVNANDVAVDLTYAFTWTGVHTHQNTMWTQDLLPRTVDTYDIGSPLYLYRSSWISTMNAIVFAENTAQVIGGWFYVAKLQGVFGLDVADDDTAVVLEDGDGNNIDDTIAQAGDFIVIRAHQSDGSIAAEYMSLDTYDSLNENWDVTRDLAGSHPTDPYWVEGTPWVLIGNVGDGRIELNANDTPRISMIEQGATYNAQTERLRIGDLYNVGVIGASHDYGFAVGNDLSLTETGGFVGLTVEDTNGLRLWNTDIEGYESTDHRLHIDGQTGHIKLAATDPGNRGIVTYLEDIDTGRTVGGITWNSYAASSYSIANLSSYNPVASATSGWNEINLSAYAANDTNRMKLEVVWANQYSQGIVHVSQPSSGNGAFIVKEGISETSVNWDGSLIGGYLDNANAGGTMRGIIAGRLVGNPTPTLGWDSNSNRILAWAEDTVLWMGEPGDYLYPMTSAKQPTLTVDTANHSVGINRWGGSTTIPLVVSSDADSVIFAGTHSATGNPLIGLYQVSTRRSFIQHLDSGDEFKIASEYGGIGLYTGTGGTETLAAYINTSQQVGIGIGAPDGTLHVHTASAGSVTASTAADDLVVEIGTTGGISILTPDASLSTLVFGSPSDNVGALAEWQYSTGLFQVGTATSGGETALYSGNFTEAMRIDSSQQVGIGTSSITGKLHIVQSTDDSRAINVTGPSTQQIDGLTLSKAGNDGRNWLRWEHGNGTADWRMGMEVYDLVIYNAQGASPTPSSPGTAVVTFGQATPLTTFHHDAIRIASSQSPASGGTGVQGEIAWDSGNLYVCTATNTWKKVTLTGGY